MTATRFMPAATRAAQVIPQVLTERNLEPFITRYVLVETPAGAAWLFVVLDAQRLPRMEAYITRDTLHHLSTALRGRPVVTSNSNGLRYAVLLSAPPRLPKALDFPGWRAGLLQLGQGVNGREVLTRWGEMGHALVGGMTGSGKSNFLRLLALQAIQEGHALALCDPDGRTFPQLAGNASLIAPIGATLEGCQLVIDAALQEITRRVALYSQAAGYPDALESYNAAPGAERLPRLLVVLDEFNGLIAATGGSRGALAQMVTRVAWQGRKFGVTLVLAGQDFTKEIVGPVRDQMTSRLCFRVASASTSRVVLGRSGAERIKTSGRAWSNLWGLLQTYHARLSTLQSSDGLTQAERQLAERLIGEYGGRMTYDALDRLGYPRRQADRLRRDWQARGLAAVRPAEDNALVVCLRANVQAARA